jgi:general secretion pathway protein A
MYLNFFGLSKGPFHITPDPAFLFSSASHKEAYASVVYGVEQRKGFIVLTGEVGTGKTTILRSFLSRLDRDKCRPIYLFNPEVTFDELVRVLLQELGGQARKDASSAYLLHKLYWTLVEEYKQERNVVLLIDEAQNMPVETMERVRMLSNLETTQDKLLQIVFVGQPELDEKLNRQELRQLRQRMAVRARLRPLTPEESLDYISHRLETAGARAASIFSKGALASLVRESKGSPRTLNILCDNALIAGFGNDERPITAKLVNEVIADYRGIRRRERNPRLIWAAAAGVVIAAGALLSMLVPGEAAMPGGEDGGLTELPLTSEGKNELPTILEGDAGADQVVAQQIESLLPVTTSTTAPAALPELDSTPEQDALSEVAALTMREPEPVTVSIPENAIVPTPETAIVPEMPAVLGAVHPPETTGVPEVTAVISPIPDAEAPLVPQIVPEPVPVQTVAVAAEPVATPLPATTLDATVAAVPSSHRTYKVTEGEYLTRILVEQYGTSGKPLRDKVLAANPQILDEDVIIEGETLVLPAWDAAKSGTLQDGEMQ